MSSKHVVILVHGIRDRAIWLREIVPQLKADGFTPAPVNYGRFDLLRFLFPIPFFRKVAARTVASQIQTTIFEEHKDATYSIIAHSFGTYVTANILAEALWLRVDRIIFCGSVLGYDFPFQRFAQRFAPPILNEVGTADIWPAVAESVTWGYGSGGTFGFNRPLVIDRWHEGADHHDFLNANFCHDYWVPFLKDGTVVSAPPATSRHPSWLNLISIFPIKYFAVALILLAAWLFVPDAVDRMRDTRIMIMDGYSGPMVYSEATRAAGGTNVSDILSALAAMPGASRLEFHPVHVFPGWDDDALILKIDPDILVVHMSAFNLLTADPTDASALARIDELLQNLGPDTQVVVYSKTFERGQEEGFKRALLETLNSKNLDAQRLHILALSEPMEFATNNDNKKQLRELVKELLNRR